MAQAPTSEEEKKEPVVALHPDVERLLVEWAGNEHKGTAKKARALISALAKGADFSLINALLKQLDVDPLKGIKETILELGPKRKKGGAPRIFLLRDGQFQVFLAAALEKGSTGSREIATAKQRGSAIAATAKTAKADADDVKRWLDRNNYTIIK